MKYKTATTVGSGILGGGGLLAAIMVLNSNMQAEILRTKQHLELYVQSRNGVLVTEIEALKEGQKEIKDLLKTVDRRVYRLSRRRGERHE